MPNRFWIQAHDLERLEQLRYDTKDLFGGLITIAYANRDVTYARTLEVQYNAALAYLDHMINRILSGSGGYTGATIQPVPSGVVVAKMKEALVCAFDRDSLRMMVRTELNESLDAIAGGDTLDVVTFNLIEWAQRTGNFDRLCDGALKANSGNRLLADTVAGIRATGQEQQKAGE